MTLEEALDELEPFVRFLARTYFVAGMDADDLEQEARIALIGAFPDWRPEIATWATFGRLAARRWLITQIITARRMKRGAGAVAVSLEAPLHEGVHPEDGFDGTVGGTLRSLDDVPLLAEQRTRLHDIALGIGLTPLEHKAVVGIAVGASYAEIEGFPAGTKVKIIDNALQRARAKLEGRSRDEPKRRRAA